MLRSRKLIRTMFAVRVQGVVVHTNKLAEGSLAKTLRSAVLVIAAWESNGKVT
jgi:hypothetical protein